MALTHKNCAAVILAGGQSRRMGQCKALLSLGEMTLISRLAEQLADFGELWISTNNEAVADGIRGKIVKDYFPGLGPLAGLHAALSSTEKDYIFCISCDLPCFTSQVASAMLDAFPQNSAAMVCKDNAGHIHPLCGIYAKKALPVVEQRLRNSQLRMLDLLQELQTAYFLTSGIFPDEILTNVNTPEAFSHLCERWKGENICEG